MSTPIVFPKAVEPQHHNHLNGKRWPRTLQKNDHEPSKVNKDRSKLRIHKHKSYAPRASTSLLTLEGSWSIFWRVCGQGLPLRIQEDHRTRKDQTRIHRTVKSENRLKIKNMMHRFRDYRIKVLTQLIERPTTGCPSRTVMLRHGRGIPGLCWRRRHHR
jgi:hypothetical protein